VNSAGSGADDPLADRFAPAKADPKSSDAQKTCERSRESSGSSANSASAVPMLLPPARRERRSGFPRDHRFISDAPGRASPAPRFREPPNLIGVQRGSIRRKGDVMRTWFLALLATAASAPAADPVKGLALHEWGVFTVHEGGPAANSLMKAEWDALPKFVFGRTSGRQVPERPLLEVNKPVIHLHADPAAARAMTIRVDFPGGRPMVWWPAHDNRGRRGGHVSEDASLVWRFHVGQDRNRGGGEPQVEEIPAGHWMERLRRVRCADLFFADDVVVKGGARTVLLREKFVYYDGLLPVPDGVRAAVGADRRVTLTGAAKFAATDVLVIDRSADGKLRVGRVAELEAGAVVGKPELADTDAASEVKRLTASLIAAGLNADEAASLAEIWRKEFFETAGVQVIHRLPQAEYDRLLPLQVEPRPEKIVRVGLMRRVLGDPALDAKIRALAGRLDDEDFDAREAATKELAALGPAAAPALRRMLAAGGLSAETRSRLERALLTWEVPSKP
jgi:hypothetical protein